MSDQSSEAVAKRFREMIGLCEAGFESERERLRREFPQASEQEIQERFNRWLLDRPMDGEGVIVPWPRPRRAL